VTALNITWPSTNGALSKVKLDGDVIWDGKINCADGTCTAALTSSDFKDGKTNSIETGKTDQVIFEFEKKANTDLSLYMWTVDFGTGCTVSFGSSPQCVLGYPFAPNNPRTSVVFNESEVLTAFSDSSGTIKAWATDEHAMLLGVATPGHPVSPLPSDPGHVSNPKVGDTTITDGFGRPFFPALFITDITTDPNSRAGDWQFGGTPIPPSDVFGTWKGAVVGTGKNGIVTDNDPAANGSNLGPGSDAPPAGTAVDKYLAEVRWNVADLRVNGLPLIPGHTYRLQFMVHDGDQNKIGGDVGQGCLNVNVAP
jgi:hypothetical protein